MLHLFNNQPVSLLVLWLVKAVGQAALAAVVAVEVACHEDPSAALVGGALTPQPVDFAVLVDLREEKTSGLHVCKQKRN